MLDRIKKYEEEYNIKVLYLIKFGSHLYGTNTPASDTDYKGIFLPSKEDCYFNTQSKHISYTSGKNDSKNGADDFDFEMWSLQYWIKLLEKGDTNAMDLLYSYSYMSIIEYIDPLIKTFLENPTKMFDIDKCKGYSGYIKGQVKKYGIKGERVGVFKYMTITLADIVKVFNSDDKDKLSVYIDYLLANHYDSSYCFEKNINNERCLVVCGKVHQGSITLKEFYNRIKKEYDKYGDRSKLAEKNEGVDWKAVSHAMRAVYQMKELILTNRIQFPLKDSAVLTDIKLGKLNWNVVSKMVYNGLNEIDEMIDGLSNHKCKRNNDFLKESILNLYN